MILEIINPSDAYTMKSDDKAAAAAAVTLVGNGQYALTNVETGEDVMTFVMFCKDSDAVDAVFKKYVGMTLDEIMKTRLDQVIEALESILIGSGEDRIIFEKSMAVISLESDRQAFADIWHDKRRTSLNDIGGRAKKIGAALREKSECRTAEKGCD